MSESRDPRESFGKSISADAVPRFAPRAPAAPVQARQAQAPRLSKADLLSIKGNLHERLLKEIGDRNLLTLDEAAVKAAAREFVDRILSEEDVALNEQERAHLTEELEQEALGIGPLSVLMGDPAVSDILVNRFDDVYVERFGRLEKTDVRFRDSEHLVRVIERIAARIGRRIDAAAPMLDARLADGSRVNATLPPVSLDGPTLSIRRFGRQRLRR
ncbi:MAG TPA: ATPase, T2SS/T4P/T4SS family, partial [Planctomycetota bacterium]|nr:ATPase, T2SS/T4P/T4SS family [Planctomycetota bacterium]